LKEKERVIGSWHYETGGGQNGKGKTRGGGLEENTPTKNRVKQIHRKKEKEKNGKFGQEPSPFIPEWGHYFPDLDGGVGKIEGTIKMQELDNAMDGKTESGKHNSEKRKMSRRPVGVEHQYRSMKRPNTKDVKGGIFQTNALFGDSPKSRKRGGGEPNPGGAGFVQEGWAPQKLSMRY